MTVSTILFLITCPICVIFVCTKRPLQGASFQPIREWYDIVKLPNLHSIVVSKYNCFYPSKNEVCVSKYYILFDNLSDLCILCMYEKAFTRRIFSAYRRDINLQSMTNGTIDFCGWWAQGIWYSELMYDTQNHEYVALHSFKLQTLILNQPKIICNAIDR